MSAQRSAPLRSMVGWAVAASSASLLLAVGVSGAVDGARGAAGAAGSGAVSLLFFVSGYLVQVGAVRHADAGGMSVVLLGYLVRVALVGAVLFLALGHREVSSRMAPLGIFLGVVLVVVGWIGGMVAGHQHARIPVFDGPATSKGDAS